MDATRKGAEVSGWASPMDRWHDENTRIAHAIKPDGRPACGVSYYAFGQLEREPRTHACRRCLRAIKGGV
jgi:hypothetical protein